MEYLKKSFMEILDKTFKLMNKYYQEKKDFFDVIMEMNKQMGIFCKHNELSEKLLIFVFLLLIIYCNL